jgi:phage FluMu protein Com
MIIKINGKDYKELRCYNCQNFIIYHNYAVGIVYYKCPRCHFENEFTFKYLNTKENIDTMKQYEVNNNTKGGEK